MPNHKYTRIPEILSTTSQKTTSQKTTSQKTASQKTTSQKFTTQLPHYDYSKDKRIVQLKNIAYTPAASRTSTEVESRVQVLESLVPISRSPWSSTSSLIASTHDRASAYAQIHAQIHIQTHTQTQTHTRAQPHTQDKKSHSNNRSRAKLSNPAAQAVNVPISSWL